MLRCDYSFSSHSACRNHFKKVHANHSICCPVCKKVYVAFSPHNFLLHFRNAHPNSRMPFNFDSSSTANENDASGGKSNEHHLDDDVITLNACGVTTKWRIPANLLNCPVLTCHQTFKERSNLISHYKEHHANGSIYCKYCDKPLRLSMGRPLDFIRHFEKLHPNHKMPFDFSIRQRNRNKKIIQPKFMVRILHDFVRCFILDEANFCEFIWIGWWKFQKPRWDQAEFRRNWWLDRTHWTE